MSTMTTPHAAPSRAGVRALLLATKVGLAVGVGPSIGGPVNAQSLCPPSYEITEWFQGPSCGIFGTAPATALAINDLGQIVGYYGCGLSPESGFRRDPDGTFVTIPKPPGYNHDHRAWGINNSSQIAGTVEPTLGGPRGYRRTANVTTLIEPPEGWWGTEARAINAAGWVVGAANPDPQSNPRHPFVWDGETLLVIEVLTGVRGWALDINDHGVVVGWMGYNPTVIAEPFIWNGREAVLLPLPEGAVTGQATAINNNGDVLVSAVMNEGLPNIVRPYLWRNGGYTALPFLEDYGRCWPLDINDDGVAVGYCDHHPQGAPGNRAVAWAGRELIELLPARQFDPPQPSANARSVNSAGVISGKVFLPSGTFAAVIEPLATPTADLDRSGSVGVSDLGALLGAWGSTDSPADLDCDGVVDSADLGILLLNWGRAG